MAVCSLLYYIAVFYIAGCILGGLLMGMTRADRTQCDIVKIRLDYIAKPMKPMCLFGAWLTEPINE